MGEKKGRDDIKDLEGGMPEHLIGNFFEKSFQGLRRFSERRKKFQNIKRRKFQNF